MSELKLQSNQEMRLLKRLRGQQQEMKRVIRHDSVLHDAVKSSISQHEQALLQWDFGDAGFPNYSVQMPVNVVDQILDWRDAAHKRYLSTNRRTQ